jgi:acetylornithine deacetylase/succinyl-diaminopimelate desuccinylase-like protein
MAGDPVLGSSSVAPTLIVSDQTSANVIPGEVRLSLDWRTIPGEGIGDILAKLSPILSESIGMGPTGDVGVSEQLLTAYTGYTARMPVIHPPYLLSDAHPLVIGARDALAHALERPIDITTWDFATDGGHLMARGVPTIGFSPGDESVVHTTEERISLALMEEALAGTIALATQMPRGSTDR